MAHERTSGGGAGGASGSAKEKAAAAIRSSAVRSAAGARGSTVGRSAGGVRAAAAATKARVAARGGASRNSGGVSGGRKNWDEEYAAQYEGQEAGQKYWTPEQTGAGQDRGQDSQSSFREQAEAATAGGAAEKSYWTGEREKGSGGNGTQTGTAGGKATPGRPGAQAGTQPGAQTAATQAETQGSTQTGEPELKTDALRDKHLEDFRRLNDQYMAVSGYADNPVAEAELEGLRQRWEDARTALSSDDERLGNGRQYYTAEERGAGMAKSWGMDRLAGDAGAVGALLQSAGQLGTGERNQQAEAELAQIFGTGEYTPREYIDPSETAIGRAGLSLFGTAQDLKRKADEEWGMATRGFSNTEMLAASGAKALADVGADVIENVIVPGAGTARMYAGAAGQGALDQAGREGANDYDAIAIRGIKDAFGAFLSTKLVGGMEGVYGQSVLGKGIGKLFDNASPAVQKMGQTLLNTEGVEEGLEDLLNFAGDQILGLNPSGQPLEWDEVKQDAFIGYVIGVITNGLASGASFTGSQLHTIADEGIEFANSGLTMEEAAEIGTQTAAEEEPVIRGGLNPEAEAQRRAEAERGAQSYQDEQQALREGQQQRAAEQAEAARPSWTRTAPETGPDMRSGPMEGQTDSTVGDDIGTRALNETLGLRAAAGPDTRSGPMEGTEGGSLAQGVSPEERQTLKEEQEDIGAIMDTIQSRDGEVWTDADGNEYTSEDVRELRDRYDAIDDLLYGARAIPESAGTNIRDAGTNPASAEPNSRAEVKPGTAPDTTNVNDAAADGEAGGLRGDTGAEPGGNLRAGESVLPVNEAAAAPDVSETLAETAQPQAEPEQTATPRETVEVMRDAETNNIVLRSDDIRASLNQYGRASVFMNGNIVSIDANEDGTYSVSTRDPGSLYTDTADLSTANDAIAWAYQHTRATEAATEPQSLGSVNTQAEAESGVNERLTATNEDAEGSIFGNPVQNTEQTGNPEAGTNPNRNPGQAPGQQNIFNEQRPGNRREKISQYFSNTLTESGRAEGLDPITYNPTSEAESLTNAAMRLSEDKQAVLDSLMNSPAWNGEMTDAAWLMENEFYKQFARTGDRTALDAWKRIQTHKISETAKGLQAVAKQSRPGAAGVLEASLNLLDDLRTRKDISKEDIDAAEKDVNDVSFKMAQLEAQIDELVENGSTEEAAKEMAKEDYLDLAEEINRKRNTGLFSDMGKNTRAGRKAEKLNTRFRQMLGRQDMDFIQRFVACQAAGLTEDLQYKGKQDIGKRINTFQKLAQLTGTGTWLRNLSGNASFGVLDLLANNNPVTLLVDQMVKAKTGKRSVGLESGIFGKGVLQAAKIAAERSILEVAANIDLAEDSENTKYDLSRTRTYDPNSESLFERFLSRWEQWNGYMLNSSDKMFRGGIEQSVTDALARANGWDVNNLTPEQQAQIRETAQQVADYRLFQNDGIAAGMADSVRDTFNRIGFGGEGPTHRGGFGLGTALMPYTKVPTNIGVKALEWSPAGLFKGIAEAVRVANNADTATMAQQNQAVTDIGRGVTGTALIAVLAEAMRHAPFFKDWEDEDDKDVYAQNKAEGKYGMQFNLDMMLRAAQGNGSAVWENGDRTIDISSIEPLNQILTAASLMADGKSFSQAVLTSAKDNFLQLPSVSAISNIENTIKYTDTPDDIAQTAASTAASTIGGVASGFIPAPVRHLATVTDDKARDTSGSNATERAVNQIKAALPGTRQTLPEKTDNYGNAVDAGDLPTRLLNTYGGNKYSQINQSDVSREMERLRESTGDSHTPARNGPSSMEFGTGKSKEKVKLTADERRDYKNTRGQEYEDAVERLMQSSYYRNADDATKGEMLDEIMKFSNDTAKVDYAEGHDVDFESNYAGVRELDNPPRYLGAKAAFTAAKRDGDWDAVDTLLHSTRQSMTEGDRAYMSEHADGYKKLYEYAQTGVGSKAVTEFDAATKELYTEDSRESANGYDLLTAATSGRFTDKEADAFANRTKKDGTYYIGANRHAVYQAVRDQGYSPEIAKQFWDMLDADANGKVTKAELKASKGAFPKKYQDAIDKAIRAALFK